jgi:hypothetical protein
VSEHHLNDADVDAVREQAARAFVPQVVPAEIDPFASSLRVRRPTYPPAQGAVGEVLHEGLVLQRLPFCRAVDGGTIFFARR